MENGRYITGPYGWLISKCHVIKESLWTDLLWIRFLHAT